jgi:hypothetical protein
MVGTGLVGVVAVMEYQEAVGQEEHDEAQGDKQRDPSGPTEFTLSLGEDVEESDRHNHTAGEGYEVAQPAGQPHRRQPTHRC